MRKVPNMSGNPVAILYPIALALITLWAVFWMIRLGVRYGVNDALRMNRGWLREGAAADPSAVPTHEPASQSRD